MSSNRPKHMQARLEHQQGIETQKAPCSLESQRDQSASAAMEKTALSNATNDLMESIVEPGNLETAWRNVKGNRGAPGPDGVTIDQFLETTREQWSVIRQQLLEGTYQPGAARRKSIPKPDGSERHLGIPTDTGKSTPGQSAFGLCRNRSSLPPAVSTAFLGAEKPDGGGSGVCNTKGVAIRNLFGPQGLDVDTLQRSLPRCWRAANDPAAGASGRFGAARPEAR